MADREAWLNKFRTGLAALCIRYDAEVPALENEEISQEGIRRTGELSDPCLLLPLELENLNPAEETLKPSQFPAEVGMVVHGHQVEQYHFLGLDYSGFTFLLNVEGLAENNAGVFLKAYEAGIMGTFQPKQSISQWGIHATKPEVIVPSEESQVYAYEQAIAPMIGYSSESGLNLSSIYTTFPKVWLLPLPAAPFYKVGQLVFRNGGYLPFPLLQAKQGASLGVKSAIYHKYQSPPFPLAAEPYLKTLQTAQHIVLHNTPAETILQTELSLSADGTVYSLIFQTQ